MWDLTGRTALVSDVSVEFGGAISRALARAGAFVLVKHGGQSYEARSLVDEIRRYGGKADGIRSGGQGRSDATTLGVRAREISGRGIDVLVQSLASGSEHETDCMTLQLLDRSTGVDIVAPCRLLDEIVPALEPEASIVLVPPLGEHPPRHRSVDVLNSSIHPLVRKLSTRLGATAVRVNAVSAQSPRTYGLVSISRSKWASAAETQARDVATVVTFLASRCSRRVDGKVLDVDSIIGL